MDGFQTQRAGGQRPVKRRPSQAVYRRRRLVAGLLALLLLAGLAFLATGLMRAFSGDGAAPAGAGTPSASHSAAAAPTPSATAPAAAAPTAAPTAPAATTAPTPTPTPVPAACPASSIAVAAATDAQSYAAPAAPVLTMTVTNTGTVPCEVNVGTTQMEFAISSGADRIFSSVDCQEGGEDLMKLLEPGGSEVANFPWDGLRSAPGCADTAPELQPKPGWYVFTAKLGEVSSEKAVFELQ